MRGKAFVWLHNGADAVKDREGNVTGHRMVDGKRFGWVEFSTPKTAWDDVLRAIRDEVDKG